MKKIITTVCLCALLAGTAHAEWSTYIIRDAATVENTTKNVNGVDIECKEFTTTSASQKAAWGTDLPEGATIGDLQLITIQRHDDTTRFAAGTGPAVAPYFNIWVTDNQGHYAVVANEPSNTAWQENLKENNSQWVTWETLFDKRAKIFENSNTSWIDSLDANGDEKFTFDEISSLTIQAPTAEELSDPTWSGLGGGAPRELGTNVAYDFNWVFGDTLSNYVSGDEGYIVSNPAVSVSTNAAVPEPGTLTLILLGVLSLVGLRARRK